MRMSLSAIARLRGPGVRRSRDRFRPGACDKEPLACCLEGSGYTASEWDAQVGWRTSRSLRAPASLNWASLSAKPARAQGSVHATPTRSGEHYCIPSRGVSQNLAQPILADAFGSRRRGQPGFYAPRGVANLNRSASRYSASIMFGGRAPASSSGASTMVIDLGCRSDRRRAPPLNSTGGPRSIL